MIVKAYSKTFPLPQHQTEGSAGMDLQADLLSLSFKKTMGKLSELGETVTVVEARNSKNNHCNIYVQDPNAGVVGNGHGGFVGHIQDADGSIVDKPYIKIPPQHRVRIATGLYLECPEAMRFEIVLRSSIGWKKGLIIPNSVGVIDSDYRGELFLILFNPLNADVVVWHGERIAQLILSPTVRVEWQEVSSASELTKTERGGGGFGSTGK